MQVECYLYTSLIHIIFEAHGERITVVGLGFIFKTGWPRPGKLLEISWNFVGPLGIFFL